MGDGWRTSRMRSAGEEYVEVRVCADGARVRHSRDTNGPVLTFTVAEWDSVVGRRSCVRVRRHPGPANRPCSERGETSRTATATAGRAAPRVTSTGGSTAPPGCCSDADVRTIRCCCSTGRCGAATAAPGGSSAARATAARRACTPPRARPPRRRVRARALRGGRRARRRPRRLELRDGGRAGGRGLPRPAAHRRVAGGRLGARRADPRPAAAPGFAASWEKVREIG